MMKYRQFYSAIFSAAMLFSTATFYACDKEDDSKPDNPVTPENPKDPDNPEKSTINADELSQTIKALAETATDGKPVALSLDASVTNDDLKTVAEALNKNNSVNVSLDLSKTGITAIPASAFKDVKNLAEVVLPQKTITLDPTAFEGSAMDVLADGKLVSFKDAKLAENVCVLAHVTEIPDSAFFCEYTDRGDMNGDGLINKEDYVYNETLKKVSFAEGSKLTKIGVSAFDKCYRLSDMAALPDGVKIIGHHCFCYCGEEKLHISLPKNLEIIGEKAFYGISMGDDFEIPSSVQKVDSLAFSWRGNDGIHLSIRMTDGKAKIVTIPYQTKSFVIPNTWTEMPFWIMVATDQLKTITFQEGCHIETFFRLQFYSLRDLEGMEIPASVKEIGAFIFDYSASNTEETFKITFEKGSQVEKIDPWAFSNIGNNHGMPREIHLPKFFELSGSAAEGIMEPLPDYVTIYCPANLVETFKAADCYKNCTIKAEE